MEASIISLQLSLSLQTPAIYDCVGIYGINSGLEINRNSPMETLATLQPADRLIDPLQWIYRHFQPNAILAGAIDNPNTRGIACGDGGKTGNLIFWSIVRFIKISSTVLFIFIINIIVTTLYSYHVFLSIYIYSFV